MTETPACQRKRVNSTLDWVIGLLTVCRERTSLFAKKPTDWFILDLVVLGHLDYQ